jgi:hypothetical protein
MRCSAGAELSLQACSLKYSTENGADAPHPLAFQPNEAKHNLFAELLK